MEKYRNFSLFIILIPTPDIPHFYYMLGGNLGSLLYGDLSVMFVQTKISRAVADGEKMVIKIAENSSSEEDWNLLLWHLINDKKENNIKRERERKKI